MLFLSYKYCTTAVLDKIKWSGGSVGGLYKHLRQRAPLSLPDFYGRPSSPRKGWLQTPGIVPTKKGTGAMPYKRYSLPARPTGARCES